MGKVRMGMTTNEVETVLGRPDKWQGKIMVYDRKLGMSVAQSKAGALVTEPAAFESFSKRHRRGVQPKMIVLEMYCRFLGRAVRQKRRISRVPSMLWGRSAS